MSASERLRERKPEGIVVSDAPYEGYTDAVLISEAERDLIADVVEAAEDAREVEDYVISEYEPGGTKLQRSLTALQEALNGSAGDGGVT